jgi:hypothetical protein
MGDAWMGVRWIEFGYVTRKCARLPLLERGYCCGDECGG